MNAPLPAPTRALIATSAFVRKGGFLLPFVFVGLMMYAKRLILTNERFRVFYDAKNPHGTNPGPYDHLGNHYPLHPNAGQPGFEWRHGAAGDFGGTASGGKPDAGKSRG